MAEDTQATKDYLALMRHFVEHHCEGKQYDTCTACPRYMSWGCSHPEHPANQQIPAFQPAKE